MINHVWFIPHTNSNIIFLSYHLECVKFLKYGPAKHLISTHQTHADVQSPSPKHFLYPNFLIKISRLIVIELFYFYSEYFYNETTKSISISFSLNCALFSLRRVFFLSPCFSSACNKDKHIGTKQHLHTLREPPSEFEIPSN